MDGKFIEFRIYETPKSYDSVRCLCYEAKEKKAKSIQVFPCMIDLCKKMLVGSDVEINAVISYPHGGFTIEQKAAEAKEAVEKGAANVEVVVNTREIKSHNFDYIYKEMKTVKDALPKETIVKFNIEIECLTDEEVIETAKTALRAGIDYISTSTGLYHALDENRNDVPLVASPKDVRLIKEATEGKIKVQAEGYISTTEIAEELIAAGADIISTEYVDIMMN